MLLVFAVAGFAFDHELLPFLRQFVKWDISWNIEVAAHPQKIAVAFETGASLPGPHDTLSERFRAVRQGKVVVNRNDPAKTAASRAGADGMIETEQSRGGFAILQIALGAVEAIGKTTWVGHFMANDL